VRAQDLILDEVYYLPPWNISFAADCGPQLTTWQFDTLPGGASDTAYLDDFYVVPPTCGDYDCRDYYIDLGFIPDSQLQFSNVDGEHTLSVTVSDFAGNSASQEYTYSVIGQPDEPPVANPQSVTVSEGSPTNITLTGSDPNHDPLLFSVGSSPSHGIITGIAPDLVYTPEENYLGPDSFSFSVNDCHGNSDPAMVSLDVIDRNDPPVADPQTLSTDEDTSLEITLSGSDPNLDPFSFSIASLPVHGTLSGTEPNLTYTPSENFYGKDSFTFIVNDGQLDSSPAEIDLTIFPVDDPPLANPQVVTATEDTKLNIMLTGTDVDGDPLTYQLVTTPTFGTLSGTAPDLTYKPVLNYNGDDSFTFSVSDGTSTSAPATVSITVTAVNDVPIAYAQSLSTIQA
jgi:hypothetical protein